MFDLEAQIKRWRAELARTGINAAEVIDELEAHLRERVDRLIANGSSEQEAFQTAVQQLGDGRSIKAEFSKLKRSRWRIFHGNPLGINVLAVWFVVMGLNPVISLLERTCVNFFDFCREVLQNYSFKGVRPIFPGGLDWTDIIFGSLLILIGIGLIRRWKYFRIAALVGALPLIYSRVYYFVLGHVISEAPVRPLPAGVSIHYEFLGMFVPHWLFLVLPYIGLTCLSWGVYELLRAPLEKFFRRMVTE